MQTEITLHRRTARDLLRKSHEIHRQAVNAELTIEHIQIMTRVIEFQKMAIKETKKSMRLEKLLQNRQRKTLDKQLADLRDATA